jgi:hypothetical protein
LATPATEPFTAAIHLASVNEIRRVRLLSMAQAGAEHRQRWPGAGEARLARPTQHDRAGRDGGHAECYAPVEVFAEGEPRQQGSEHAFRVQQQRGAGSRHAGQAEHQQHRPDDAAGDYRAGEPERIPRRQAHRRRPPECAIQRQPEARAEVEQARQQPRAHGVEQPFRQRGTRAEQQRGAERGGDSGMTKGVVDGHLPRFRWSAMLQE